MGGGSRASTRGSSLVGGAPSTPVGGALVGAAPLYCQELLLPSAHLAYDAGGGGGGGGGGAVLDPSALHNLSQVHSLVIPCTHQLSRMLSKAQSM